LRATWVLKRTNNMLLELKDVRVYYGKAEALKGVSIMVEEGSIVVLIGSNGAGKTTMLRTISGLKKVTSGQIFFEGKSIDGATPREIVVLGIAHVPEGRQIFPYMTVRENLAVGAYARKDKSGVIKSLEMVYTYFPILKERARQMGGSLSGGEQQMLAIGRALMTKSRLILMDEPSLGLSPTMVTTIGKVITNINQQERVSILLVEQNARMALRLAQRGYVIETGKIVLEGDCKELINNEEVRKAYLGG
jgi:branched-chain amino acid transport system ATP-binding protein